MNIVTPDTGTLDRLNRDYPGWRIWRSRRGTRPAGWVATNRDPGSDRAPTLHGATPADLETQLKDPPPRWAKPLTAGVQP